jgi:hypothetical protein
MGLYLPSGAFVANTCKDSFGGTAKVYEAFITTTGANNRHVVATASRPADNAFTLKMFVNNIVFWH